MKRILLVGLLMLASASVFAQEVSDNKVKPVDVRAFYTAWGGTASRGEGFETGLDLSYKARKYADFLFGGSIALNTSYAYDIKGNGDVIVNNSDGFTWVNVGYSRSLPRDTKFNVGLALKSFSSVGDDEFNINKLDIQPSIGFSYMNINFIFNAFMFVDMFIDTDKQNEFTYDVGGGISFNF